MKLNISTLCQNSNTRAKINKTVLVVADCQAMIRIQCMLKGFINSALSNKFSNIMFHENGSGGDSCVVDSLLPHLSRRYGNGPGGYRPSLSSYVHTFKVVRL